MGVEVDPILHSLFIFAVSILVFLSAEKHYENYFLDRQPIIFIEESTGLKKIIGICHKSVLQLVIRGKVVQPFSHLSDEKLMELYQEGESLAFDLIYERHNKRVFSYLKKRISNEEIRNDIFQNIFIKFHNSRMRYNSEFPLVKWLYVICRSVMLDHLKKRSITTTELEPDHLVVDEAPAANSINLDEEKKLTEKEREVIKLRYFSDKEYSEISEILDTSESNVRKIFSRGLLKLKFKYVGRTDG